MCFPLILSSNANQVNNLRKINLHPPFLFWFPSPQIVVSTSDKKTKLKLRKRKSVCFEGKGTFKETSAGASAVLG